jgi:hypothetical protein
MTAIMNDVNAGALLHMAFSQLSGVPDDYVEPEEIAEINWVVANASFDCRNNNSQGVYDFIFNLDLLDDLVHDDSAPTHIIQQLKVIQEKGYSYILFHQEC